jgi:hypothetical protein
MDDRLKFIFANVNDWLKFAEAKNAMIIAFNSASIYGITKTFDLEAVKNTQFIKVYLMIMIAMLVFSAILALISFAPRVKIVKTGFYAPSDVPNIIFFEYLKDRSTDQILSEVLGGADKSLFTSINKDIAEQIRQNSIIASRKYSHFTIAVWLTITAYVSLPFALMFCGYNYLKD